MGRRDLKYENIKEEDLPEPYQTICRIVGMTNTLRLAKEFGGSNIYFPKFSSTTKQNRDELIYQEFNGSNYKDIAKRYNLSDSMVRKIIEKEKKLQREKPIKVEKIEQINIFSTEKF